MGGTRLWFCQAGIAHQQPDEPIRPFSDGRAGAICSKGAAEGAGQATTEDEEAVIEEEFGTRTPRVPRRPLAPTKAQLEEHMPLHVDYRCWCPHCVAGRGISHQHSSDTSGDAEKLGTTVSVDYCFWVPEEVEDDTCPVLVACDDTSKAIWAIAVEEKGADHTAVTCMADKLEHYGYSGTRIIIKRDQAKSVVRCKRGIALKTTSPIALIESPIRESKSNEAVEGAVRRWRHQFRTRRHHF